MRKNTFFTFKSILFLAAVFIANESRAQAKYFSYETEIKIKGTSTLHDWEMSSAEGNTEATINFTGPVPQILALKFLLPSESLKSSNAALNKNAYKSLKTQKYRWIAFTLSTSDITELGENNFKIRSTGILDIAGVAKEIEINALCKVEPDGSLTCEGSKNIKMTDFGITPPTFMMRSVKTGDDITISFQQKIHKH
jgi:polyisoprenoid-binding protein YceI